jgi:hypothetical protein
MSADTLQHVWDANSIRLIADGVPAGDLSAAKVQFDGDHCCHNLYHVVRPRMADWLAERLAGRAD